MNVNLLDVGLPVEHDELGSANNDITRLKKYCDRLGKKYSELTAEELEKFRNEAP